MDVILPPGFSEARLRGVLGEIARELGDGAVACPPATPESHLDPFHLGDPHRFAASAVVSPGSVEEIQAVLRIANEHRLPLWTVSLGKNLGYGGPAPRVRGSVIVELSRLNRVLEVNEDLGYAVLEPGVQFFDLYRHLKDHGHRLWMSAPGLGWGSVVANALERGVGQSPHGDHSAFICGMEVVLANGDVVRTGMGSIGDGRAWHLYKGGYGPTVEGIFLQSNYGIVTKMGIWLMPEPECFRVCEVAFAHDDDLRPMIDTLRPFKLNETIQGSARAASALRVAQGVSTRRHWTTDPGPISEEVVARIVEELGIGRWNLKFGLHGEEAVVEARLKTVTEAFGRIPDARFTSRLYPGDVTEDAILSADRPQAGIPAMLSWAVLDWLEGETAHIGFSPLSPLNGQDALDQVRMVRERAEEHGFDYGSGLTCGTRLLNHIFLILYDPTDPDQTGRLRELYGALVADAAAAGYGEYRTHLEFMDVVAATYDFDGGSQLRMNTAIKQALDPNGILSPGKQGIWPPAQATNGRVQAEVATHG
jgi:4-cresol dehydrogenase (hydroxylating) flavoprotein subunit